jgi:hypothetical protein
MPVGRRNCDSRRDQGLRTIRRCCSCSRCWTRAPARFLVLAGADDGTKDLEVLVLRQRLQVLRRTAGRPRLTGRDRVLLAAARRALPRQQWPSLFLVTPPTLLRWHRELVRRKWTGRNERQPGRPPVDSEVVALGLRLARENPRWGCVRIWRELRKVGSGWAPRRSGRCSDGTGWARRLDAAARRGRSSSKPQAAGTVASLRPAAAAPPPRVVRS